MEGRERERVYLLCGYVFLTFLDLVFSVVVAVVDISDALALAFLLGSFVVAAFGAMLLFSTGKGGVVAAGRALLWIGWLLWMALVVRGVQMVITE